MLIAVLTLVSVLLIVQTVRLYAPRAVFNERVVKCSCGKSISMCDDCSIKYRFRYVAVPPDEIRWSKDGGPHPYNDCGDCVKYVRSSSDSSDIRK